MILFDGLLDECGLVDADADGDAERVLGRHLHHQSRPGPTLGRLVVPDSALVRTARQVPADRTVSASVLITGGAGGLVALGRRSEGAGLVVTAAESALRDLDDLAGNAARVVAAARELPEAVVVFVELPGPADLGWQRAVEVIESAGLLAKLTAAGPVPGLAARLSALVEADLPFKLTGLTLDRLPGVAGLVDALIEGAEPAEAANLEPVGVAELAGWDDVRQTRVRRRLISCDGDDPGAWLERVLDRAG